MSNSIAIEFENNQSGHFIPGTTVTGNVNIFLSSPKKSRHIKLYASGAAKTSFTTETSNRCSLEKPFFNFNLTIWKALNNDEELIPSGKHSFKFSFEIPGNCLPNFEGENGNIRYLIKAEMHISLQFNLVNERPFFVLSILNVPLKSKPVKRMFLSNGIHIEVILPKEDFACDENVEILININNQSKSSIESIETGIKTRICYKGTKKQKGQNYQLMDFENSYSLLFLSKLYIPAGYNDSYKRNLQLKQLYPTITDDVIDVKHFVYVKMVLKKIFSSTVTEIVPLTLYATPLPQTSVTPTAPFDERVAEIPPIYNSLIPSFYPPPIGNGSLTNMSEAPPPYDEIFNTEILPRSNISTGCLSSSSSFKDNETSDQKF